MALRWMDGFDWAGTFSDTSLPYFYTVSSSGASIYIADITAPRSGVGAVYANTSNAWYLEKILTLSGTVIVGLGMNPTLNQTTARDVLVLLEGSTVHLTFKVNTSKQIEVYRGTSTGGTLLGTSTLTLSDSVWQYMEFVVSINDSTGTVDVFKDDVSMISLTSQDTKNGGTGVLDTVRFGKMTAVTHQTAYDDFYVADTSGTGVTARLGSGVRVDTLKPSGAGSSTVWTPSSGANYTCVDDTAPNADSDYVTASNSGDIDLYAMGNLTFTPGSVKGLSVSMIARKDDVGTRQARTKLKSGSTTSNGASLTLTTSYVGTTDIFSTNPDTSTAWTETTVNAIEAGVEHV